MLRRGQAKAVNHLRLLHLRWIEYADIAAFRQIKLKKKAVVFLEARVAGRRVFCAAPESSFMPEAAALRSSGRNSAMSYRCAAAANHPAALNHAFLGQTGPLLIQNRFTL